MFLLLQVAVLEDRLKESEEIRHDLEVQSKAFLDLTTKLSRELSTYTEQSKAREREIAQVISRKSIIPFFLFLSFCCGVSDSGVGGRVSRES